MPSRRALKDLTLKQATFATEYVHCKGNGTKSAKRAGYAEKSAHVAASRALSNDKVIAEIVTLTRKHDISAERVLTRLDNLSIKAEEANDFSTAVKAESLLGKSLGMWVDRSFNVNVNAGEAHLQALLDLASKRSDGAQ